MSGALTGIAAIGSMGLQGLAASGVQLPALLRTSRKIGVIVPDVTIEEQHEDRLQVTQHPVALGSPVSDHAFMLPPQVAMRLGWSNSNLVAAGVQGFMSGGGFGDIGGGLIGAGTGLLSAATEGRIKDINTALRKLQFDPDAPPDQAVVPFRLVTGKRTYEDMVITELSVQTATATEYSLIVECRMQQVFIVNVQSTTQPAQAVAPQEDQADPSKTANPTNTPDKTVAPKPTSTPFLNLLDGILKPVGGFSGYGGAP